MINFGVLIILLTYCLWVHNVVKSSRYGINEKKLSNVLFGLLVVEIIIFCLTQINFK